MALSHYINGLRTGFQAWNVTCHCALSRYKKISVLQARFWNSVDLMGRNVKLTMIMKTEKRTIWAIGLIVCALSLHSCDLDDDDNTVLLRPTALVTVYPNDTEGFTMRLNDSTTIVPTNMKTSPFGKKQVRALVNYTVVPSTDGSPSRDVYVNWIDSIRTKNPVASQGSEDEKVFGNDPIEIVKDWVSVAEDGYITLRIRTLWGGKATHVINLVSGVNAENAYEFDLRHDAKGDTSGGLGDAIIAFDLNSLWEEQPKDVKVKLNWKSFSGEKSTELDLKMHSAALTTVTGDPVSLLRME